jgi:predicted metal-binding membrane protein
VRALLRQARAWEASLVGALLALAALAWFATGRLAEPDMRFGLLTGGGSISPMDAMSPALGLFVATWIVMMIAMMFPAVAPVVVTVHRWIVRTGRPRSDTVLFVAGYLLVWTGFGGIVYALIVHVVPLMPGGDAAIRVGAAVLLLAGVYQFTPLKNVCLWHCRSPLAFIAGHTTQLQRGGLAGARVGVLHGVFCLGCCWMLMLVLVVMGMMSLAWMAAVTAVIFAEKVLPRRLSSSSPVGFILVGAGIALMLTPKALPAFA